jgi:hypothetical protein
MIPWAILSDRRDESHAECSLIFDSEHERIALIRVAQPLPIQPVCCSHNQA